MKKMFAAALAAFLIPLALHAQVVDFGLAAGYSMNNEALRLKGTTTTTWLGVNHGFYAGPQLDFNLGKGFSIRTGFNLRKGGSDLFLDLEKLAVNFNQIALDVENGNQLLFDYLKENPELDLGGITSQELMDGIDTYHDYVDKAVETLKGCDIKANVDRYSLNFPVLFRYTAHRLSVSAGVNLNVMLWNKVDLAANLPGGMVYSGQDMKKILPYAHLVLTLTPPSEKNPTMTPERFYTLDVANRFTVGLQFGVEYAITDWISLHLSYMHGLSSEITKPWTDVVTLRDRAIQVGAVYHFHFKKK